MEFAKQGFDTNTALQLSNVASQFQNIADTEIDAATAAKFINSQLKAFGNTDYFSKFNTDAEKATAVIDAVNEVANNFGVGTNDLQMALTKTSAAMKGYGNTYSETIGLITAGTEVMPNQASKVARGWRTIGANILKLAQDTDTLEAANGKVSVSLKDENGELRSTFQILKELYPQWKTLNSEERSALALSLAGKTQTEVFQATMDNFTHAIEANETAMNSQGSAAKENAKYLDSIQGRVKAFQSAWEQLSYHIISSDLIKNVVSVGTKIITTIDSIVQKIGALPTVIGLVAGAFGALKLGKLAFDFLKLGTAAEGVAKSTKALAGASQAASGTTGLGGLVNSLKFLTNPVVLGGLATLAGTIALMEIDKYFSLDSSIKRLDEYKNKLQSTIDEIEALKKKRDSDEGLTNAEKTHLAVLEAEERSLERQIKLEQQRIQNAFKRDVNSTRNKKDEASGRTGPTQLLDYQDSRKKELELDTQILEKKEQIADAEKKAQYYRMQGDDQGVATWEAQAEAYTKQLDKMYDEYVELDAEAAEASANLGAYWEQVSSSVDYDALSDVEKEKFDEIHKAFIESQIDASNLKDSYTDVSSVINSAMDSLGHDNLNLFDNIDISSITTVEDAIKAIYDQIQSLDGDTEISFQVKDDNGEIETITKKVSELTEEDYEAILNFSAEGLDSIEQEKDDVESNGYSTIYYDDNGTLKAIEVDKISAADSENGTITFDDNGTTKTIESNKIKAAQNVNGKITFTSNIGTILSNIRTAIAEKAKLAQHAKGKRKGEEGGLAWLGDEGTSANPKPELVVSENGEAYLAGTTGWEMYPVKNSDTVYTYAETKKLLGGRQVVTGFAGKLPRYKKGKISDKTKKKKRKEFDKKLKELEHKRKVNHWTDEKYQDEYKKLYNKYEKYLKKDQKWDYSESREDYENKVDTEDFERRIENIGMGHDDLAKLVSDINKNTNLSADEKVDAIADAYKASVEYNLKEYQNGKNTRDKVVRDIKNYYATRGKYDEDYYKMLDELREADQKKEVERLKKLEEQQENKLTLAQKYLNKELNAIEKQIEAEKEQEENEKKLVELQNELNKAKSQTIRIYKEGQGFVYEQDVEAIKNAQEALDEYTSSQNKSELEKRAEEIRDILDLFDELEESSDIHELELALGVDGLSSLTGGDLGSDIDKWSSWIKGVIASQVAYTDLSKIIGDLNGTDIDKWLGDVLSGGNHEVSSNVISEYLAKHSFASGTLSAPGGLSILGEHGVELAWLDKGDSVYPNAISRNLMEWGRYNPAQVLSSNHNSSISQIFNFDKIVLPNVRNAEDFYRELQKLPNMAIQQSTKR